MSAARTRKAKSHVRDFNDSGASARGEASDAKTETDSATSRSLEALIVAVRTASDTRQWYTVTKELQLASLRLCEACRGAHAFHLRIDGDLPTTLLAMADAPPPNPDGGVPSRVPRFRARCVSWKLPTLDLLSNTTDALAEVEELFIGEDFNSSLEVRAWPSGIRKIEFTGFSCFDKPISGVSWPRLEELTFGWSFDHPIDRVKWPTSLKRLSFGGDFDQPIHRVKWPTSLQRLAFTGDFNHPIKGVKWPPSLEELAFGTSFNQPIQGIRWPSVRRLTLRGQFLQSLKKLGDCMPALERLTLQLDCDPALYVAIMMVMQWPAQLSHLTVGKGVDLGTVPIPIRILVSYSDGGAS